MNAGCLAEDPGEPGEGEAKDGGQEEWKRLGADIRFSREMKLVVKISRILLNQKMDKYWLSKMSGPFLYSKLLYKMGQDFLVIHYCTVLYTWL